MEKDLLHKLYQRVKEVDVRNIPASALSGLLHGYLSVYSMIRVYPWLEDEFESPWDIHERVREIGRVIQGLLKDHDIPVDERAGYVVDLMDTYLLYSDIDILETALDAAYEILIPKGSDKMVLPCRTANVCRMLCNCYYFTGEEECGELAGRLVTEAIGMIQKFSSEELIAWWDAFRCYENIIGEMKAPIDDKERLDGERTRLGVSCEQVESEKIEVFQNDDGDICLCTYLFDIMARRELAANNEVYSKRE